MISLSPLRNSPRLYEPTIAGAARKRRRRWRRWFLQAFGPGRVYFPGQWSDGAW